MEFSAASGREVLARLRQAGRGAIVVTTGLRDLRLVVEPGGASVEASGAELGPGGAAGLARAFLCALFWEDPTALFVASPPPRKPEAVIEVEGDVQALLGQIDRGLAELADLHAKVHGLDCVVSVHGAPPPEGEEAVAARLFRAVQAHPKGVLLGHAAGEAGLDALDAAWATFDLLDMGQAVVKRPPPTVAARRAKQAEARVEEGLDPPLRCHHLARQLLRSEPRKAAQLNRLAGDGFRADGRHDLAIVAYRAAAAAQPDDVAAREGLVAALAAAGRAGEERHGRQELVRLYSEWGLPSRARSHLERLDDRAPEQRDLLLETMLRGRDFAAAGALVREVAPLLARDARRALAARFAKAGATGAPLRAAVAASGVQALRPLRRLLFALTLLTALAAGLLGAELELRRQWVEVVPAVRADVDARRFAEARGRLGELAAIASQVRLEAWPAQLAPAWPHLTLAQVPATSAAIDALEADWALLARSRETLAWRSRSDTRAADEALAALRAAARTDALRARVDAARAEVAAYREQVAAQVKVLRDRAAFASPDALAGAQRLMREHMDAADLFGDLSVMVRLFVEPAHAALEQDGRRVETRERDGKEARWLLPVPLDPALETSLVAGADGWARQSRTFRLSELLEPELRLRLVQIRRDSSLAAPSPPDPGARLAVRDDGRGLAAARQANARVPSSEPAFEPLRERLGPDHRLVIILGLDVNASWGRGYLKWAHMFLEDVGRGARATPRVLDPGTIERPLDKAGDELVVRPVQDAERGRALVEAAAQALDGMLEELEGR